MSVAAVALNIKADIDHGIGLADGDVHITGSGLVVGVAVKGPVGGAAGDVGIAGAQMQQTVEVRRDRRLDTHGRAGGPMRVAVIDTRVTADIDHGIGLADADVHITGSGLVVGVAVKGPVGGAAGDVGIAGAQMQQTVEVRRDLCFDDPGSAGSYTRAAAAASGVYKSNDHGIGLADGDVHITGSGLV